MRARRQQLDSFFDQRNEVERARLKIELTGFDFGEVENVLDQRQQSLAGGLGGFRVRQLFWREAGIEQQIGHAEQAVEWRANFMTDHGEKVRLGTVGGFRQIARRGEGALGLDPVRDVAADALHFIAGLGTHRDFAPGNPARNITVRDLLVMGARAVGQHHDSALLANR